MSRNWLWMPVALIFFAMGCEDGPEEIYRPLDRDPPLRSGDGWTQPGEREFGAITGGDSVGRARFCDEAEATAQIEEMVRQPIIPDGSVGGLPVWGPDGRPLVVDDLLGRPEDGKFCDPTGTYSNAFVWGPTNEVIVFFDEETRLVDAIMAYQSYLGTLSGSVTVGETTREVVLEPRERVRIDGRELDQYTGRATEAERGNAWLNHANVTLIYGMIRQTFFGAEPLEEGFDCVDAQLCDVIYTQTDESVPQDAFIDIQDSGIQVRFTPEGQVVFVYVAPVRVAPFEVAGTMNFGAVDPDGAGGIVAPRYDSISQEGCAIDLAAAPTWAEFRDTCIDTDVTLRRVSYDVATQRDSVSADFNGINLQFARNTSTDPVYRDGERPADGDRLVGMTFTRSLGAVVPQFVPRALATSYVPRLQARLRAAVDPAARDDHPFGALEVAIPESLDDRPQRIGELMFEPAPGVQLSWIAHVIEGIQAQYDALTQAERAAVDPRVIEPVFLVEPFVEAVLSEFSVGLTDAPGAFKALRTTDDERWSIGFGHFVQDGITYRLVVQYSLNFGAVTAVSVERGDSEIDAQFLRLTEMVLDTLGAPGLTPYYDLRFADPSFAFNPFRLGGDGIQVGEVDRQLDMVQVTLASASEDMEPLTIQVPGAHIEDRSGFMRQIRGERYEFVPAHEVILYGRETIQVYHVLADGTIGRISQGLFKGRHALCSGATPLAISYGTDVREAIEAWRAEEGDDTYQDCDVVFNYSEDGFVLESVASLQNRIQFSVTANRATTVTRWQ